MICPCCKGLIKVRGTLGRPEEIEFFLRLHGMWEGIIDIPPPPESPYDIETMKPLATHPRGAEPTRPKHHLPNGGVV